VPTPARPVTWPAPFTPTPTPTGPDCAFTPALTPPVPTFTPTDTPGKMGTFTLMPAPVWTLLKPLRATAKVNGARSLFRRGRKAMGC